jgi:hypothetical protein
MVYVGMMVGEGVSVEVGSRVRVKVSVGSGVTVSGGRGVTVAGSEVAVGRTGVSIASAGAGLTDRLQAKTANRRKNAEMASLFVYMACPML